MHVLPTPVSPSNRTLYVTSHPLPFPSTPGDVDDDDVDDADDLPDAEMRDDIRDETREDDVAVDDVDGVDIRDIFTSGFSYFRFPTVVLNQPVK